MDDFFLFVFFFHVNFVWYENWTFSIRWFNWSNKYSARVVKKPFHIVISFQFRNFGAVFIGVSFFLRMSIFLLFFMLIRNPNGKFFFFIRPFLLLSYTFTELKLTKDDSIHTWNYNVCNINKTKKKKQSNASM